MCEGKGKTASNFVVCTQQVEKSHNGPVSKESLYHVGHEAGSRSTTKQAPILEYTVGQPLTTFTVRQILHGASRSV
jgi:hypothetical protein